MSAKLDEEGAKDKEIYDKNACWCKTNVEDKTNSISSGKDRVKYLTGHVEQLSGHLGSWLAEAANIKKDIEKAQGTIDQSNALRAKQKQEFQKIEADVLETIDKLVQAEAVVESSVAEENKTGSLLQSSSGANKAQQAILMNMRKEVAKHADLVLGSQHSSNIDDFLQNPSYRDGGVAFLQHKKSGEPGADDALGVIGGVKEDFVYNLGDLRTKETENFQSHRKLMTAKEAELLANEKQLKAKTEAHAKGEKQMADEKDEIVHTKQAIADDTDFLKSVQEKCRQIDKEWDSRQQTRADESEAISKAMEVLGDDEARESFSSGLSFFQESSVNADRRARVSATLERIGRTLDVRLVTLAMSAKLDNFDRVKKSIDEMAEALKTEQANEVKHRDYCIDELNKNALKTDDKNQSLEMYTANIGELSATMRTASDEISALQSDISESEKQLKLADQLRESENKEFQPLIKEQSVVQELLQKAIKVLKGFYATPALIQVKKQQTIKLHKASKDPPAENLLTKPEGFKEYKQQSGGAGVISLMEQLISDSKNTEAEAREAEKASQKSYEEMVKVTTADMHSKKQAVIELMDQRANDESDRVELTDSKTSAETQLKQLVITKAQLHESCDFVLQNFEVSQKAREEEIEALRSAKGILAGDTATDA
eukprot:TRINITY_DN19030_c0_g1_i1.p1 TRINITY_DN19030_c0_g1~~TRINITY_DN19030_c0_g1_i1.p1  ORF type:complete len:721 (-),score=203.17 TRINITY_DN19030_c0_g1_i1:74-2047(-)